MLGYPILMALVGGVLIGLASSALLFFLGRIAGISGIAGGLLQRPTPALLWRYMFVAGLLAGGILLQLFYPQAFVVTHPQSYPLLAVGGLLVGYGTRLGGGCTSGHGVCGLARRSLRSLYATLVFMAAGMVTVYVWQMFRPLQ